MDSKAVSKGTAKVNVKGKQLAKHEAYLRMTPFFLVADTEILTALARQSVMASVKAGQPLKVHSQAQTRTTYSQPPPTTPPCAHMCRPESRQQVPKKVGTRAYAVLIAGTLSRSQKGNRTDAAEDELKRGYFWFWQSTFATGEGVAFRMSDEGPYFSAPPY